MADIVTWIVQQPKPLHSMNVRSPTNDGYKPVQNPERCVVHRALPLARDHFATLARTFGLTVR